MFPILDQCVPDKTHLIIRFKHGGVWGVDEAMVYYSHCDNALGVFQGGHRLDSCSNYHDLNLHMVASIEVHPEPQKFLPKPEITRLWWKRLLGIK